ncbi:hypothetical protein GCM10023116_19760 [Kistimonas scapharcae]|uniref:Uncharacterized protein n=1 Tax=Kistimonas scapharcae TaxID=1036133 RepID=A0ABP8V490_9GAMM
MQIMKRLYFANGSSHYGDKCKVYKELQDAHRWRQSGLFIQPGLIQKYLPKGGLGATNKSLWNYGINRECAREDVFIQQQKNIGCTIGVSNVANSLGDEIVSVDILHALYGLGYAGNIVVVYNCPCCGHIDVKGDPQDKKQKDGPREGHYFRALLRRVIPSFLTRWYNRWQQRREYDGAIKALQLGIDRLVKNRDDYQRLAWKQETLLGNLRASDFKEMQ